MDDALLYVLIGTGFLFAAILPPVLHGRPLSLPFVFLVVGVVVFALPLPVAAIDVVEHRPWLERLAEITVIMSLAGVGLRIDRPPGWRAWSSTWRLLAITMPLTIAATALLGLWAGFAAASALLLGAALAPTDPVLAGEVQVGEPGTDDPHDEPRFALTSEAGLNDALAFPFVWLAILVAERGLDPTAWLGTWLGLDVAWKLAAGLVAGVAVGRFLAWLTFRAPHPHLRLSESAEGFVVLAGTLLTYGITELVHGYGFLAVFVAAVTARSQEREHDYITELVTFGEQVERLLIVLVLLLLGGAIADGLLAALTWRDVVVVLLLVFVVRPVAGYLALLGGRGTRRERRAIAFFGVRGVGSVYYLAFALGMAEFTDADRLWAVVALAIAVSTTVFGIIGTPAFRQLDRRRESRRAARTLR